MLVSKWLVPAGTKVGDRFDKGEDVWVIVGEEGDSFKYQPIPKLLAEVMFGEEDDYETRRV